MVAPIYENKKGIYRDLYREINSENQKKKADSQKQSPKGIYKNLYINIRAENKFTFGNKKKKQKDSLYNRFIKKMQGFIKFIISKISYCLSSASIEEKPLIIAYMFAKQPINNYIENSIPSDKDYSEFKTGNNL